MIYSATTQEQVTVAATEMDMSATMMKLAAEKIAVILIIFAATTKHVMIRP